MKNKTFSEKILIKNFLSYLMDTWDKNSENDFFKKDIFSCSL